MKLRFIIGNEIYDVLDRQNAIPRVGDKIEVEGTGGGRTAKPVSYSVAEVHWIYHDVIPADVVIVCGDG